MRPTTKHLLSAIACTLILATPPIWAGFEQSHEAYTKGDYTTAFKGYLAAANSGDSRAYGKVAALYLYGRGTEKDFTQAYIWFAIAEESKDKYATRFLDATASMLTRKQIEQAELALTVKREQLKLQTK